MLEGRLTYSSIQNWIYFLVFCCLKNNQLIKKALHLSCFSVYTPPWFRAFLVLIQWTSSVITLFPLLCSGFQFFSGEMSFETGILICNDHAERINQIFEPFKNPFAFYLPLYMLNILVSFLKSLI